MIRVALVATFASGMLVAAGCGGSGVKAAADHDAADICNSLHYGAGDVPLTGEAVSSQADHHFDTHHGAFARSDYMLALEAKFSVLCPKVNKTLVDYENSVSGFSPSPTEPSAADYICNRRDVQCDERTRHYLGYVKGRSQALHDQADDALIQLAAAACMDKARGLNATDIAQEWNGQGIGETTPLDTAR